MASIREAIEVLAQEGHEAEGENSNRAAICALQQVAVNEEAQRHRLPSPAPLLVADKTDWYHLRSEMAKNCSSLLGLKNRCRIWKDCKEILDRIHRYRDEGKIIPGQTVDAREVAEAAEERQREHNRRWRSYCAAGRPGEFNSDDWA
jgi:hypothetical protein